VLTTTIDPEADSSGSPTVWRDIDAAGTGLGFEDFLSFRLGRLNTLVQREMTQRYLEPFGLTHPEWRVLARLARHDSIEMRELTRVSLMDKAAISRAVDVLLGKGLAERHEHPAHAKRRIVAITPAGRRTMRKVQPHAMREQAALLRILSADERSAFGAAIAKLTQALLDGAAADGAPAVRST
jgi:DNA-binding MarR family transcriptional regulator